MVSPSDQVCRVEGSVEVSLQVFELHTLRETGSGAASCQQATQPSSGLSQEGEVGLCSWAVSWPSCWSK